MSECKSETDDETTQHMRHECPVDGCKAHFRRRDRLCYHVRQHRGQRFQCKHEDCHKSYASPSGLKRHQQRAHQWPVEPASKQHKCEVNECGRSFETSWGLKKHVNTFHCGKDYKCNVCGKAFRKSRQLKVHEFEHTGVAPFKCNHEQCGKAFKMPCQLKQHQKQHQGYTCDVEGCEEKFDKWTLYHKHKKLMHARDYKCEVCCRMFKCKQSLRSHQTTHSETREIFVCSYEGCPKFFYFARNLKHHVDSTHEGKRHKCTHNDCDMEFKNRVTLLRHLKLHSPKIPPPVKVVNVKVKKCRRDRGSRRKSAASLISGHQPDVKADLQLIAQNQQPIQTKLDEAQQLVEVVINEKIIS